MKRIALTLLLAISVSTSHALEISGVQLDEKVVLDGANTSLVLNGAGIRKKFFLKIYLGALYLSVRQSDATKIINADEPSRIQMDMLYSEVKREKLVDAWNDGFSANHSADELAPLRERIEQFNGMFDTLVEGDRVQLDYVPGKGTWVTLKGEVKGIVPGYDFHQALLKIWLGDSPVTSSLKKAMLGN